VVEEVASNGARSGGVGRGSPHRATAQRVGGNAAVLSVKLYVIHYAPKGLAGLVTGRRCKERGGGDTEHFAVRAGTVGQ